MRASSCLVLASVALCLGCSSSSSSDWYEPFDASAFHAAQAEEQSLRELREVLESKDFTAIQAAYAERFEPKLQGFTAAHAYVEGGATLGAALDQEAQQAIAMGAAASDEPTQEAAEEIVQGIVSRYTFETIYREMGKRDRPGWDRAFAFYGLSQDGTVSVGLAALTAERDTEFGTHDNEAIFDAFVAGHGALKDGEAGALGPKADTIDGTITKVFARSAHHEFAEGAELVDQGKAADAIEPFAVGRGLVAILRDYMKTRPDGAATVAAIDAEMEKGDPAKPETMSAVDFHAVVTAIDTTFGLAP